MQAVQPPASIELRELIPIVAVIVAIISFLYTQFNIKAGMHERLAKLEAKVDAVVESVEDLTTTLGLKIDSENREVIRRIVNVEADTHDIPVLKMQMEIFWSAVREHVPAMLVHPDDPERDVLIMKIKAGTATLQDATRLKAMLEVDLLHDPHQWATFLYIVQCDFIIKGSHSINARAT